MILQKSLSATGTWEKSYAYESTTVTHTTPDRVVSSTNKTLCSYCRGNYETLVVMQWNGKDYVKLKK